MCCRLRGANKGGDTGIGDTGCCKLWTLSWIGKALLPRQWLDPFSHGGLGGAQSEAVPSGDVSP